MLLGIRTHLSGIHAKIVAKRLYRRFRILLFIIHLLNIENQIVYLFVRGKLRSLAVQNLPPFIRNRLARILTLGKHLLFILLPIVFIYHYQSYAQSGKSQQYQNEQYHQLLLHSQCKFISFFQSCTRFTS